MPAVVEMVAGMEELAVTLGIKLEMAIDGFSAVV
jgi:hypothetical protein